MRSSVTVLEATIQVKQIKILIKNRKREIWGVEIFLH